MLHEIASPVLPPVESISSNFASVHLVRIMHLEIGDILPFSIS